MVVLLGAAISWRRRARRSRCRPGNRCRHCCSRPRPDADLAADPFPAGLIRGARLAAGTAVPDVGSGVRAADPVATPGLAGGAATIAATVAQDAGTGDAIGSAALAGSHAAGSERAARRPGGGGAGGDHGSAGEQSEHRGQRAAAGLHRAERLREAVESGRVHRRVSLGGRCWSSGEHTDARRAGASAIRFEFSAAASRRAGTDASGGRDSRMTPAAAIHTKACAICCAVLVGCTTLAPETAGRPTDRAETWPTAARCRTGAWCHG